MTFGAPSPRPCTCACVCKDPGPLAARLREAARLYASGLIDGDEIDGDHGGTDYAYVLSFAAYLPAALVEAGFRINARLDKASGRLMTQVRRQLTDTRATTQGEAA